MVGGGGRRKEVREIRILIFGGLFLTRLNGPAPTKSKSREPAYSQALIRCVFVCLRLSPSVYLSHAHKTLHFYKTYIFQNILKRLVRLQCEFFPELGHRDPETENFCHSMTETDPILDHTVPL